MYEVFIFSSRLCLDALLNKPLGLFALLDEETKLPNASKSSLMNKVETNFKQSKVLSMTEHDFTIKHFAGEVTYNPDHFIEKNRNFLSPDVIANMRDSTHEIVNFLFSCPLTSTGRLSR